MSLFRPTGNLLSAIKCHASSKRCLATAAEAPLLREVFPIGDDANTTSIKPAGIGGFDPVENAKKRTTQLPSGRYQFRSPRFFRGPLHPHQPPPPTDIASREFVPGPFTRPRLKETYDSIIAPDMLTLAYNHIPPGTVEKEHEDRMRPWPGKTPYEANRLVRGPRGRDRLLPVHRPIKYHNVPALKKITVHSHVPDAGRISNGYLQVASLILQSITNVRQTVSMSKKTVAEFEARAGKLVVLTATLEGEDMYHFLAKIIELVLPRRKDWKGLSGQSGDLTGNISFGLQPAEVALFPEILFNYGHYPPQMMPGMHIHVETTATNTREGRLLLMALGIPFQGELRKVFK